MGKQGAVKKPVEVRPDFDQGKNLMTNLVGGIAAAIRGLVQGWSRSDRYGAHLGQAARATDRRRVRNKMARRSRRVNQMRTRKCLTTGR